MASRELVVQQPSWFVRAMIIPLHDAVIEDLLDRVEDISLDAEPGERPLAWGVGWREALLSLADPPPWDAQREAGRRGVAWAVAAALGGLSALHLAWAFGSTWPGRDGPELTQTVVGVPGMTDPPPAVASAAVAGLLATAAGVVLARVSRRRRWRMLGHAGTAGVATVLAARAAGGVRSACWPQHVTARFRRLDLAVYSPLCALLAGGAAFVRSRTR